MGVPPFALPSPYPAIPALENRAGWPAASSPTFLKCRYSSSFFTRDATPFLRLPKIGPG